MIEPDQAWQAWKASIIAAWDADEAAAGPEKRRRIAAAKEMCRSNGHDPNEIVAGNFQVMPVCNVYGAQITEIASAARWAIPLWRHFYTLVSEAECALNSIKENPSCHAAASE